MERLLNKTSRLAFTTRQCRANLLFSLTIVSIIIALVFGSFAFEWDIKYSVRINGANLLNNNNDTQPPKLNKLAESMNQDEEWPKRKFYEYYLFATGVLLLGSMVFGFATCVKREMSHIRHALLTVFVVFFLLFGGIGVVIALILDEYIRLKKFIQWVVVTVAYFVYFIVNILWTVKLVRDKKRKRNKLIISGILFVSEGLFNFVAFLLVTLIYTETISLPYYVCGLFKVVAEICQRIYQLIDGTLIYNLGQYVGITSIIVPGIAYIFEFILIPLRVDTTITIHTAILLIPIYLYLLFNVILLSMHRRYTFSVEKVMQEENNQNTV